MVQSRINITSVNFREISKRPKVYAHKGNPPVHDLFGRSQHCPVASENNDAFHILINIHAINGIKTFRSLFCQIISDLLAECPSPVLVRIAQNHKFLHSSVNPHFLSDSSLIGRSSAPGSESSCSSGTGYPLSGRERRGRSARYCPHQCCMSGFRCCLPCTDTSDTQYYPQVP